MSLNTSHTPDGRGGVLIYNGEVIMVYTRGVVLHFEKTGEQDLKGKKNGAIYLTSHRIIFISSDSNDRLHSFCMPFHCMRDVKLEQPILGANYLHGIVMAQPGGNWEGDAVFKVTFNKGGCIDFGQALLRAVSMAHAFHHYAAPPPYTPPAGGYFCAPPAYYMPTAGGNTYGFQAPTNVFPDAPPANDVYMYESPPPYSGIGPSPAPYPAGQSVATGSSATPTAPPSYAEATNKKNN